MEVSGGNIFADLGLEYAQYRLAKAQIAIVIRKMIEAQKLTQRQAASKMRIGELDASNLSCGRLEKVSLEGLLTLVRRLGADVEIKTKPSKSKRGRVTVIS